MATRPVASLIDERKNELIVHFRRLAERTVYRRAVEAINWGMPAVNFDLMLQAMIGGARRRAQSDRLLVASAGLEDPDIDPLQGEIGTRPALAAVRILVDPNDPKDVAQVHALQPANLVRQPGGPGRFEVPNWDQESQKKVRDAADCAQRDSSRLKARGRPQR
jgi:hypothetical protein